MTENSQKSGRYRRKLLDFAPQVLSEILTESEPVPVDGLLLLSRSYCHLCDDMHQALLAHGFTAEVVDVDADDALVALWDEKVPVLLLNGQELCHYHLTPQAVEAIRNVK